MAKRVYSSNAELAHVWAQQTQSSGRANNTYFEGNTIYSYGSHFKTGVIHTGKGTGERFAVINASRYSNSTCKHVNHAWRAVYRLMPAFSSPCPEDLRCVRNYLDGQGELHLQSLLKRVKVQSESDIKYAMERYLDLSREADSFRKIVGLAKRTITKKERELVTQVREHLTKRLERWKYLNTPEMLAKRDAEAEKRREARERLAMEKAARAKAIAEQNELDDIARFRSGVGPASIRWAGGWPRLHYDLLRIKGDIVETSSGARVPLADARALLTFVEFGKAVGRRIADFTVVSVTPMEGGDKSIRIGCHTILLSEARAVLGAAAPTLTLVGGA